MALVLSKKLLSEPRPLEIEVQSANETYRFTVLTPHMSAEEKKEIMDAITSRNDLSDKAKSLEKEYEAAEESEDSEAVAAIAAEIKEIKKSLDDNQLEVLVKRLICGWPDGAIKDEDNDNQPVPYSDEKRDFLIDNVDGLPMAIYKAWAQQIYFGGSKRGNSKAPRKLG